MVSRPAHDDYLAVILAGGAARRFRGTVPLGLKTLLPRDHNDAGGATILEHLLGALEAQTPPPLDIALNIHPAQRRYVEDWLARQPTSSTLRRLSRALVIDSMSGDGLQREGPVSGIVAALEWARHHHLRGTRPARWLLSISGDSLDLPRDLIARFLHAGNAPLANAPLASAGVQWVVAANAERTQPPISLWRLDIAQAVAAMYASGERKIDRIAQQFPHRQVVWPDCAFLNVNSRQDYI